MGGLVYMKHGCNFQEVCMFTLSHCDSTLVRSVSSPSTTNLWGVISAKMFNFFREGESAFFYLLWAIISISK